MRAKLLAAAVATAAVLSCLQSLQVCGQSFSILHAFGPRAFKPGLILTNSDGVNPCRGLAVSGATLYGAAKNAGPSSSGTIFSISTNGTGFNVLYSFSPDPAGNSDGSNPNGGLLLANDVLFGTTSAGGQGDAGTVFSLATGNAMFKNLHNFSAVDLTDGTNPDGANPAAGLVQTGTTLYGTAVYGGNGASGVIFALSANGSNFRVLHHFSQLDGGTGTNSDGAFPSAALTLAGTTLYGTTSAGGTNGYGTFFSISTNGSGFAVLYHFDTNGANPATELVLSGGTFYAMADTVVFGLSADGSAFDVLYQFSNRVDFASTAVPGLTVSNTTLFGAAAGDGSFGSGQVFSLNTDGSSFASLHDFAAKSPFFPGTNSDGAFPNGGLVLLDGTLYGTAGEGGVAGSGVLFSVTPGTEGPPVPPLLSAQVSAGNFVLTFQTVTGQHYNVERNLDLNPANWTPYTNFVGNGTLAQFAIPPASLQGFFRVRSP